MDQALTTFQLLGQARPWEEPGESQRRAAEELPAVVRNSPLCWWDASGPVPAGEQVLLVGVAVWSRYDLNTLDHLAHAVRTGRVPGLQLFVFNADDLLEQQRIDEVFPGLGSLHHTPAVGLYRQRRLVEAECGYAGRQLIARTLGIDAAPLHDRLTATTSST